jgi:carbon storage regulator
MLVLSRRVGERIVIGEGLAEVLVTAVRGDRVTLGVSAPREVPVRRAELTPRRPDDDDGRRGAGRGARAQSDAP